MAERSRSSRSGSRSSASKSEVEQKRREAEKKSAEQNYPSALDRPDQPDEPSAYRGYVYFGTILLGAFVLNMVVLILISGGR